MTEAKHNEKLTRLSTECINDENLLALVLFARCTLDDLPEFWAPLLEMAQAELDRRRRGLGGDAIAVRVPVLCDGLIPPALVEASAAAEVLLRCGHGQAARVVAGLGATIAALIQPRGSLTN